MAAAFKNPKSHLILLLLRIFHCSFLYPGTALSPDENLPAGSFPSGLGGNENTPVLSSPPFSTPATATNKNSQLSPSLNNQGLQSPVVYQQVPLNYEAFLSGLLSVRRPRIFSLEAWNNANNVFQWLYDLLRKKDAKCCSSQSIARLMASHHTVMQTMSI
ncbi:hypothetical protein LWI29_014383 [Acer saccharum]|uniref:Uncharacterized protein n=1 Tax=Acer saccharum TaxID=4024 RepID=A0AA39SLG1_ACESA|nr:hypothetical protein LWI29_014383 [Acer saccharum]